MDIQSEFLDLLYKKKVTCKEIEEFYNEFENHDDFQNVIKILSESVQIDKNQIDKEMYDSEYRRNINSLEYIEKNYPKAYLFLSLVLIQEKDINSINYFIKFNWTTYKVREKILIKYVVQAILRDISTLL